MKKSALILAVILLVGSLVALDMIAWFEKEDDEVRATIVGDWEAVGGQEGVITYTDEEVDDMGGFGFYKMIASMPGHPDMELKYSVLRLKEENAREMNYSGPFLVMAQSDADGIDELGRIKLINENTFSYSSPREKKTYKRIE